MLIFSFLLFFLFHSLYHNKQERFIIPVLPLFILLGIHGCKQFMAERHDQVWLKRSVQFVILWFLVLNTVALAVLTCSYSKKARVESMIWLRGQKDVTNIIMEGNGIPPPPPLFYLQQHLIWYTFSASDSTDKLLAEIRKGDRPAPDYVIMTSSKDMEKRLARLQTVFPGLQFQKEIKPGFVDNLARRLNPRFNPNEAWYIYKIR